MTLQKSTRSNFVYSGKQLSSLFFSLVASERKDEIMKFVNQWFDLYSKQVSSLMENILHDCI